MISGDVSAVKSICLLLFFGVFPLLLTSCQESQQESVESFALKMGEGRLASLNERIEKRERKLSKYLAKKSQINQTTRLLAELVEEKRLLEKERGKLLGEIDEIFTAHDKWMVEAREKARFAAIGEDLGTIELPSGKVFKKASIKIVGDAGVVISHSAGLARVLFLQLPSEWGERFFYDEDAAVAALEKEKKTAVLYDQEMERLAIKMKAERKKAEKAEAKEKEQAKDRAVALARIRSAMPQKKIGNALTKTTPSLFKVHTRRSKGYYYNSRYPHYYPTYTPVQQTPTLYCPPPLPTAR